jgi:hypothetical protein
LAQPAVKPVKKKTFVISGACKKKIIIISFSQNQKKSYYKTTNVHKTPGEAPGEAPSEAPGEAPCRVCKTARAKASSQAR